jgi:hypothetical protein
MSKTLLNAAMLQLQAKAAESLGALEVLLTNSVAISEHTNYVNEIIKHTKQLSENEEALKALTKYFSIISKGEAQDE